MAMFFLIGGLFQIVGSVALALPGWGWQVADGFITLVLGLLVLAEWPASGLWVIGLFIGIDLISTAPHGSHWHLACVRCEEGAQTAKNLRSNYVTVSKIRRVSWRKQVSAVLHLRHMS